MSNFPHPANNSWIGHKDSLSPYSNKDIRYLVSHRDRIEILGAWSDSEACYITGYYEIALIRLANHVTSEVCYYALSTFGYSNSLTTETWGVDLGPVTLDELRVWCCKALQANSLSPFLTDKALGFDKTNKL